MAGVRWWEIHTADGTFNWTRLDQVVASWQSRPWTYCVWGTPNWLSARPTESHVYGNGLMAEPTDNSKLAAFVTALVNRYPTLTNIEFWNEPDQAAPAAPPYWYSGTVAAFVAMQQAAYNAAKAARSSIVFMAPGTVNYRSSPNWLDAYFAAGGANYLDAVSIHGYHMEWATNNTPLLGFFLQIDYLAKAMGKAGISSKPIYISETGQLTPSMASLSDTQASKVLRQAMILAAAYGCKGCNWYSYNIPGFRYDGRAAVETTMNWCVSNLPGATIADVDVWWPDMTITCTLNGTELTIG